MRIGIASDHRGYNLKEQIKEKMKDYEIIDFGTNSTDSIDYTDYAFPLSEAVRDQKVDYGVAICGSGIGMSIACNKVKGIRCGVAYDDVLTGKCREHNNCNVISFGAAYMKKEDVLRRVDIFLSEKFSPLEKHHWRVKEIENI